MKQLLDRDSLKKTGIFVLLGGIGALLGSLLGYPIGGTVSIGAFIEALIRVGIWDALIGVGVGIALSPKTTTPSDSRQVTRRHLGWESEAQ